MFLLNILLAIAWSALTGQFSPGDLAFGFVLGYAILWSLRRQLRGERYFTKVPQVIYFVAYVAWQIILANLNVARTVLFTPKEQIRPGIVAIPLDIRTDAEITMLANLITLTPGTLSLDVADDRSCLYVHTIDVGDPEQFRREIKDGFERLVYEVFN
ncbi:MAG: Na+/H+ antiporter subunit E [Roseiflexus sp.]|jgi:multicomponent Na+:H+ antiporter subunit E|uniref:Na+/H+ antiporter subunit E n=1 Tax=Roseiflexus sp. TaxID=2562120 RepID=UPI001B104A19|nr:Na+/H+ antiporter subunit E [Roseiflexus sp.]MBO9326347.1 Na+/H+ antiporter subunit E [Roseiflexus sp.]MBO9336039.1 Na+/H+ antiporter subunit E [Roseiflexus sp.]MBO9366936.1 Na+/H+ antiporter subunit E [Roseiflexus sp.]MBO9366952.1 Na+/H+ antiporter subunit E [Roseiflexus sp.]MBO9381850.1 Na+/H+ antiporter subunit E [Roseiflexus sp.]